MTANRTMSSGVPMDEFYFHIRILQVELPQFTKLAFRIAVCSGLRTLDSTRDEYQWSENKCQLNKCVLNFQVPCHNTYKHSYDLKILEATELQEISCIDLNLKTIITEFLFQNVSSCDRQDKFFNGGYISYSMFVHKSRVMLFKSIIKKGVPEHEISMPDVTTKKYFDFDQKVMEKENTINQAKQKALLKAAEKNKHLEVRGTPKSNRLRARSPSMPDHNVSDCNSNDADHSESPISPSEVESPLTKIMKGKITMTQSMNKAKRREQIKHSQSQKVMIKRADSIDQDENVKQRKNIKLFLLIILVVVVGFFVGNQMKGKPTQSKKKHSSHRRK